MLQKPSTNQRNEYLEVIMRQFLRASCASVGTIIFCSCRRRVIAYKSSGIASDHASAGIGRVMKHGRCRGRPVLHSVAPDGWRRGSAGPHLPEVPRAANCCFQIQTFAALQLLAVLRFQRPGTNFVSTVVVLPSVRLIKPVPKA